MMDYDAYVQWYYRQQRGWRGRPSGDRPIEEEPNIAIVEGLPRIPSHRRSEAQNKPWHNSVQGEWNQYDDGGVAYAFKSRYRSSVFDSRGRLFSTGY